MPARYIECDLKSNGREQKLDGYLGKSGIEKFLNELGADIETQEVYMIERVNCNKTVHFLIKYGNEARENFKRYVLDRYRSGKLIWLNQIRDNVEARRKVAV